MKELEIKIYGKDVVPKDFTGKVIYDNRSVVVYLKNGIRHREDGPAYMSNILLSKQNYLESYHEYMLNGDLYTKEEWFNALTPEQQIKALFNPENW